ncbi:uncharacterized protein [Periplaneta americana]|uniref:uncharacterized protein n=1 Tax=Periplaneta americana TaxID=6978 RepID=UPI0037E7EB37
MSCGCGSCGGVGGSYDGGGSGGGCCGGTCGSSETTRRPEGVVMDETFILPDREQWLPSTIEDSPDSPLTPPRRGIMRRVREDEYPNISYEETSDQEAEIWTEYNKKSKTVRKLPMFGEDEKVKERLPEVYRHEHDKSKREKYRLNIQQTVPRSSDNRAFRLNLQSQGFSSKTMESSEDVFPEAPTSASGMETISASRDEGIRRTIIRSPHGRMQQRMDSIKTRSFEVPKSRETKLRGTGSCKKPSPMKMFDDAVNAELKKRKDYQGMDTYASNFFSGDPNRLACGTRRDVKSKSTLSAVETARSLHPDYYTSGLAEAVDKLAQAEAICRYDGAVKAAEDAASAFPEGIMAEEAAVARVRGYHAELVDTVQEEIPGVRPIELVGYIGLTRPKI